MQLLLTTTYPLHIMDRKNYSYGYFSVLKTTFPFQPLLENNIWITLRKVLQPCRHIHKLLHIWNGFHGKPTYFYFAVNIMVRP